MSQLNQNQMAFRWPTVVLNNTKIFIFYDESHPVGDATQTIVALRHSMNILSIEPMICRKPPLFRALLLTYWGHACVKLSKLSLFMKGALK